MLLRRSCERPCSRFHVREVEVAEHVGNQREALIHHGMPERQDAGLLAGHVAPTRRRRRRGIQQRPQEAAGIRRDVLQIGVLNQRENRRTASWIAVRTAAPLPRFRSCRKRRTCGNPAASAGGSHWCRRSSSRLRSPVPAPGSRATEQTEPARYNVPQRCARCRPASGSTAS